MTIVYTLYAELLGKCVFYLNLEFLAFEAKRETMDTSLCIIIKKIVITIKMCPEKGMVESKRKKTGECLPKDYQTFKT